MVSTQAAGLEEHGLDQVTDGLGRCLRGGGATGIGVNKNLEYLDSARLACLKREALGSVILVRDAVQRHPLLLQPGQHLGLIGSALANAGHPYGAVHQGALCWLLREGQAIETEQTVTLVMLHVSAEHGASQRAWRLVPGRHHWELRGHARAQAQAHFFLLQDRGARPLAQSYRGGGALASRLGCLVPLQVARVTLHDGARELTIPRERLRQPLVPEPVRDLGHQYGPRQGLAEGIERQERLEGLQVLRDPARKRLTAHWQGQYLQVNEMGTLYGQRVIGAAYVLQTLFVIRGNGALQHEIAQRSEVRRIAIQPLRCATHLDSVLQHHTALSPLCLALQQGARARKQPLQQGGILGHTVAVEDLLHRLCHFPRYWRTTPEPEEFLRGLDLHGRRPHHLALAILHVQDAQTAAGQVDIISDGQLPHD